jgi:hypothetical protein
MIPPTWGVPAGPGEDAGQADCGNTPQAVAALRNAVLTLFGHTAGGALPMGYPLGPATTAPSPTAHSVSSAPSPDDFDMTLVTSGVPVDKISLLLYNAER